MFESNDYNFISNVMSNLTDRDSVRLFIINYVKSLKESGILNYMEETESNIYSALLNHDKYNSIKKLWYPLPLKEEINQAIRQTKINEYLSSSDTSEV